MRMTAGAVITSELKIISSLREHGNSRLITLKSGGAF